MIIYKCDICGKDFQPYLTDTGNKVFSNFNHYEIGKVLEGDKLQPQSKIYADMFCSECGNKVNKLVENMKQEKVSEKVAEKKEDENTNNKV
jgi:DNA-directed RNA polymerase subunit RPC12/RpoP